MHSSRRSYLHVSCLNVLKIHSDINKIHLRGFLDTYKYMQIWLNTFMYVLHLRYAPRARMYRVHIFVHTCIYYFQMLYRYISAYLCSISQKIHIDMHLQVH